jgi:hypothetical protein
MPSITEFLFGKGDKNKQQNVLTGDQNNFLSQLFQQLGGLGGEGGGMNNAMGLLQQYLDPNSDIYKNFEQPYLNEFNQQTIPGIAERFAGLGGGMGGGLQSGAFGQALSSAAGNLQSNLAQMKSGMQRNAIGDIFGQYNQMSNQGLGTRAFENQYQPGNTGFVGNAITGLTGGLGSGAGLGLANYAGKRFFGA